MSAGSNRSRLSAVAALALAAVVLTACFSSGGGGSSVAQVATLRIFAGTVEVGSDDVGFAPGSEGQTLVEGVTVRTGSGGRASIEYFDGSVTRLDNDTTFTIITLQILDNAEQSKVIEAEQTSGNTYNRVTELTDSASRFDIETPTATASVQGTTYAIYLDPDGSMLVAVVEGSVTSGGIDIPEGFMATVSPDGLTGDPVPIPDDLIDDEWIVFNCEVDQGPECPDDASTTTTTVLGPDEPTTTTVGGDEQVTTTTTAVSTTTTTAAATTTTTTTPTTTSTTTATTTTTTTTVPGGVRSLYLDGSNGMHFEEGCSVTRRAYIMVDGQAFDEDGTTVSLVEIDGGGQLSFPNGNSAATVDGVASIVITGDKPGGVVLQAFADGLQSNQLTFNVTGGDCGEGGASPPSPPAGDLGDPFGDPLGVTFAALLALLGVAVVAARRHLRLAA